MPTILKLTGTNGSGKSTVGRALLRLYGGNAEALQTVVKRSGARDEDLLLHFGTGSKLIVLGPYETACGGCDAIQPYSRIIDKLREYTTSKYTKGAHIFMEGVMISGRGSIGEFFDSLPKRYNVVYGVMDTPLAVCIERVNARRAARGVTEPVNPTNMTAKHRSRMTEQRSLLAKGFDSRLINHQTPVTDVLGIFGVSIRREPRHEG